MRGLDTNVLVRILVADDPAQTELARKTVSSAAENGETLRIHPVVLCDLVWVLSSCYGYVRAEIATALDAVVRTAQFEIPDKDTIVQALGDYREGKGDFADYFIGRANQLAGAETTLTFNRDLKDDPLFGVLRSGRAAPSRAV